MSCRMRVSSLPADPMNLRRAGTFSNSPLTSMRVPGGTPAGSSVNSWPLSMTSRAPESDPCTRLTASTRATEAIDGRASPLKPSVAMPDRSEDSSILLVANRSNARPISPGAMPWPLSVTETSFAPPSATSSRILVAPASSEFSINSLTTEAGRSMTSPAAMREASCGLRTPIAMTGGRSGGNPRCLRV